MHPLDVNKLHVPCNSMDDKLGEGVEVRGVGDRGDVGKDANRYIV